MSFTYKNRFQCWCGNSYGSQGLATNCQSACSGNQSEICGGGCANSVYSTPIPNCNRQIYFKCFSNSLVNTKVRVMIYETIFES